MAQTAQASDNKVQPRRSRSPNKASADAGVAAAATVREDDGGSGGARGDDDMTGCDEGGIRVDAGRRVGVPEVGADDRGVADGWTEGRCGEVDAGGESDGRLVRPHEEHLTRPSRERASGMLQPGRGQVSATVRREGETWWSALGVVGAVGGRMGGRGSC